MNIAHVGRPAQPRGPDRRPAVLEQLPGGGAARGREELERVLPARLCLGEESRRRQVPQDLGQGEASGRRGAVAHRLLRAVADRHGHGAEDGRRQRGAAGDLEGAVEKLVDAPHMAVAGDLWAGAAPGPDGKPRVTVAWTPRDRIGGRRVDPRQREGRPRLLRRAAARRARRVRRGARHAADPPHAHRRPTARWPTGRISTLDDSRLRRRAARDRHAGAVPRPDAARAARDPVRAGARAVRRPAVRAHRSHRRPLRRVRPGGGGRDRHRRRCSAAAARSWRRCRSRTTAGGYEIDLPIGSIARGEYVFEIVASRGADQAKTLLSFRVELV